MSERLIGDPTIQPDCEIRVTPALGWTLLTAYFGRQRPTRSSQEHVVVRLQAASSAIAPHTSSGTGWQRAILSVTVTQPGELTLI